MNTLNKTNKWSKNQVNTEQKLLELQSNVNKAKSKEVLSQMVFPIYEESYEKLHWLQKTLEEINQEKCDRESLLMENNNLLNQMKTIQDENKCLHKALNLERQKLKRNRHLKDLIRYNSQQEEFESYCSSPGSQDIPIFSWETTENGSFIIPQKSNIAQQKETRTLPSKEKKYAKMEITNSNEVSIWIADNENNFQCIPHKKQNITLHQKGITNSQNQKFLENSIYSSSKNFSDKEIEKSLNKTEALNLNKNDNNEQNISASESDKLSAEYKTMKSTHTVNTQHKTLDSSSKDNSVGKLNNSYKSETSIKADKNYSVEIASKPDTCLDNNTSNKLINQFCYKCVSVSKKICNLNQFNEYQTGRFQHYQKILCYTALIMLFILIGTLLPVPWRT